MVERYAPGDLNGSFKVAAIATAWTPATMTWNVWWNSISHYTGGTADFTASSTTTVTAREFNVLTIVQNWANGGIVNNGLLLYDDAPSLTPLLPFRSWAFIVWNYTTPSASGRSCTSATANS